MHRKDSLQLVSNPRLERRNEQLGLQFAFASPNLAAVWPAFIADRLTFCYVFFFAARFTLGEALNASVIHDDSGAFNFQVGRRLQHSARILARLRESMDGTVRVSQTNAGRRRKQPASSFTGDGASRRFYFLILLRRCAIQFPRVSLSWYPLSIALSISAR
jgi:hypothetical protein